MSMKLRYVIDWAYLHEDIRDHLQKFGIFAEHGGLKDWQRKLAELLQDDDALVRFSHLEYKHEPSQRHPLQIEIERPYFDLDRGQFVLDDRMQTDDFPKLKAIRLTMDTVEKVYLKMGLHRERVEMVGEGTEEHPAIGALLMTMIGHGNPHRVIIEARGRARPDLYQEETNHTLHCWLMKVISDQVWKITMPPDAARP